MSLYNFVKQKSAAFAALLDANTAAGRVGASRVWAPMQPDMLIATYKGLQARKQTVDECTLAVCESAGISTDAQQDVARRVRMFVQCFYDICKLV